MALARAILARLVDRLPIDEIRNIDDSEVRHAYQSLRDALYNNFTSAGDLSEQQQDTLVNTMTSHYDELLARHEVPPSQSKERSKAFVKELYEMLGVTRYLCWVKAEPGEVVNLQVTYTAIDTRRKLGRGTLADRFAVFWKGVAGTKLIRWKVRADWYRQFGLAPLNYEFNVPSREHTGSYYFMLEPPPGVDVTYLDWESGNNLETNELDCALPSAHVHNAENVENSTERGGVIRAYLHCSARDHKLIVGTALLNCAFVFLVALGRVPNKVGTPAQSLLLAAPSVFVAYLARQQQHYFSDAMRRQRGILWWYLGISVAFLVTITFSRHKGSQGSEGLGAFISIMTWLWGISSICIATWYLPLGNSYERITESQAKRRIAKVREYENAPQQTTPPPPAWKVYERVIRRYSTIMTRLIGAAGIAMLVALALIWFLPSSPKQPPKQAAYHTVHPGTLTTTTYPSKLCKGCNLDLRFVPTTGSKP